MDCALDGALDGALEGDLDGDRYCDGARDCALEPALEGCMMTTEGELGSIRLGGCSTITDPALDGEPRGVPRPLDGSTEVLPSRMEPMTEPLPRIEPLRVPRGEERRGRGYTTVEQGRNPT